MNDKNTGGPAFPEAGLSGLPNGEFIHGQSGMTLRDYFAAHAPEVPLEFDRAFTEKVAQIGINKDGIVYGPRKVFENDFERMIRWRWNYADSMLKAREL